MQSKPKILIVEDEPAIRMGLCDVFVFHGYEVAFCEDGESGLHKAKEGNFDLILLDVMMPKMNGFEVLEAIREQNKEQAVIMLTAKSSDEDVIQGLSLGADDYVAKPFSVAQLVLRVQAVLRRSMPETGSEEVTLDDGVTINPSHLQGHIKGQQVHFTRKEMDVIQYLLQHSSRPVPREELLQKVWGYHQSLELETRTVDIHIAKIRKKIEHDPKNPQYLVTIRGAGYKLVTS